MRLFGQEFDTGTRIRGAIAEKASLTRSDLSRQVCDWLDWRTPDGRLQEVSSRKALRELERRGLIELPSACPKPPKVAGGCREAAWKAPVLLETFVDESRFLGTLYKAANCQRLGETQGRGRQDRENRAAAGVKGIYVLPLRRGWREILATRPEPTLRLPPTSLLEDGEGSWAQREFGRAGLPDGRLKTRLVTLADAFFKRPTDPIAMAMQGDVAKTQAAYRFFMNLQVDLQTLLHSHYEATAARIAAQSRVLVAQDTVICRTPSAPAKLVTDWR